MQEAFTCTKPVRPFFNSMFTLVIKAGSSVGDFIFLDIVIEYLHSAKHTHIRGGLDPGQCLH